MIAVTCTYLAVIFGIVMAMFSADTVMTRLRKRRTQAVLNRAGMVSLREGPLLVLPVDDSKSDDDDLNADDDNQADLAVARRGDEAGGLGAALATELAGESDMSDLGGSVSDETDDEGVPPSDQLMAADASRSQMRVKTWAAHRAHVASVVRTRRSAMRAAVV